MNYSLTIEILGLPKMANVSGAKSTHWRYALAETRKWQGLVMAAVGTRKPARPLKRYTLLCIRFSSTCPDFDGLVRGFKSVIDGLRHAGVIEDDRMENSGPWQCSWVKCPPKQGKIVVTVREEGET